MKVLLVDNFWCRRSESGFGVDISPHLGLMSLAATLELAGHTAEILDPKLLFRNGGFETDGAAFRLAWVDACIASGADVVGFTAYGRTLPPVIRIAELLRARNSDLPIILGGPHATIMAPRLLHAFESITAVVRFEAEPVIVNLVEALRDGRPLTGIPNVVFRHGGKVVESRREPYMVDLDSLPEPAFHLYPESELRRVEMSLEAGRGCPFSCTFCSTANFFQRRYRLKSNGRLVEEMRRARERFGVNVFNLNHDLFGLNKRSLREFCNEVRDLGFLWKCSMRSDTLDPSLLGEMRAAGCFDIYFGIETGSQRLQAIIKKRLDLAATRETVSQVIAKSFQCTVSFITGFPEETEVDQDETLDMIGDFLCAGSPQLRAQLHVLSPEPGSELGDAAFNLRFDGIGPEADQLLDGDLIAAHPEIFSVFHHFPTALPRWRVVMASFLVLSFAPKLGIPFINYLVTCHFGGKLSRLFTSMFPAEPAHALQDHETLMAASWEAIDRVVDELSRDSPWLSDMLNVSRMLSTIHRCNERDTESCSSSDGPGLPPTWLLRLASPLSSLGMKLGLLKARNEGQAQACGGFWYLVTPEFGGGISAHGLSHEAAMEIVADLGLGEELGREGSWSPSGKTPYVRVA